MYDNLWRLMQEEFDRTLLHTDLREIILVALRDAEPDDLKEAGLTKRRKRP